MQADFDPRFVIYFCACLNRDGFEANTEEYWPILNQYWGMYKALGLAHYFEPTPEEHRAIWQIRIKLKERGCLRLIIIDFLFWE